MARLLPMCLAMNESARRQCLQKSYVQSGCDKSPCSALSSGRRAGYWRCSKGQQKLQIAGLPEEVGCQ